ncbi:MAG: tRNA-binding protein [Chlamydiia bacterium]|nr:tRNA-binding protein [Chlamydiia bacterium]
MIINWEDFQRVEIRTGTVLQAEIFKEAKKPALKMTIDFGPLGVRKTSAQITHHYNPEELVGKQVLAVTNFPPKQIGPIMSEVLVLGVSDGSGGIVLVRPDLPVQNGERLH